MRWAAEYLCVFLRRPAEQLHHSSGRDADGRYLDPHLVVPLALVQHSCEHAGWNLAGFGDGTCADPSVLRLRRNGHLLIRCADHHRGGFVTVPAFFLEELGLMLHRIADDLESA